MKELFHLNDQECTEKRQGPFHKKKCYLLKSLCAFQNIVLSVTQSLYQ